MYASTALAWYAGRRLDAIVEKPPPEAHGPHHNYGEQQHNNTSTAHTLCRRSRSPRTGGPELARGDGDRGLTDATVGALGGDGRLHGRRHAGHPAGAARVRGRELARATTVAVRRGTGITGGHHHGQAAGAQLQELVLLAGVVGAAVGWSVGPRNSTVARRGGEVSGEHDATARSTLPTYRPQGRRRRCW